MLILMHHGAVGILDINNDLVAGSHIINSGICINIQYRHAVGINIRGGEETGNIAVSGSPAVINIIVKNIQPAVALAAVGMVAEGRLHKVKLRIEFIRTDLSEAFINLIEWIYVIRSRSRSPDIAVFTLCKHLKLNT